MSGNIRTYYASKAAKSYFYSISIFVTVIVIVITFIFHFEVRIPLVIHGLDNCFSLRLDKGFKGACLLTNLLSLL